VNDRLEIVARDAEELAHAAVFVTELAPPCRANAEFCNRI
jgi:hypothetical protein